MSRTNIDIDDDLVDRAMRMYRLESKRAAVQLALERLVGEPMTTSEILAMQGSGYPFANGELVGRVPAGHRLAGARPPAGRDRAGRLRRRT
ncbi:MAG: type II toxin-antitoxin system VapB family antitoxin [Acidimicrobiales bacterium]